MIEISNKWQDIVCKGDLYISWCNLYNTNECPKTCNYYRQKDFQQNGIKRAAGWVERMPKIW